MAASVFASEMFMRLYPTGDAARLFTDTAEVRALLLVEGAVAKANGELGDIPEEAAGFIHRASMELQIDPGGLASDVLTHGSPVKPMIAAFQKLLEAPEHAGFVHHGVSDQDIADTALALRIRQFLSLTEKQIIAVLTAVSDHVDAAQDDTLINAATRLLTSCKALPSLRQSAVRVALAGDNDALREALAIALNLNLGPSWDTSREPITQTTAWLGQVASILREVVTCFDIEDEHQPRQDAALAMARMANAFVQQLQTSATDGSFQATEPLVFPQLCLCVSATLDHTLAIAKATTFSTRNSASVPFDAIDFVKSVRALAS